MPTQTTRKQLAQLVALARGRRGHTFTLTDAERLGLSRKTVAKLAADPEGAARIARFDRGVYQVIPDRHEDHYVAAWRKVGDDAIASHQTALALHGLSDIEPRAYEFTIPREHRARAQGRRFRLHTATKRPKVVTVYGVPTTTPARTIVDCALFGEQTEMAVAQALARGLTTEDELRNEAHGRGSAVKNAIDCAIAAKDSYEGYL
jgi:predicted transcriptional regulator of viral defense system